MEANLSPSRVKSVFHADLSDAHPGEEYWLSALGKRHELTAHTPATRARARAEAPHLALVPDDRLTHYTVTPVELPGDHVVRVHLKHTTKSFPSRKGGTAAFHGVIHIPHRTTSAGAMAHHRIDYLSTAKMLVFHHPDLINNNVEVTGIIYDYMENDKLISTQFEDLATLMRQLGPPSETSGWATQKAYTPGANPDTKLDGTKTYYFQDPTSDVKVAAGPVTTAMMKATKNDTKLQGKKWTLQTGKSVTTSSGSTSGPALATRIRAFEVEDAWTPALQNTDSVNGLELDIDVVEASKKQVKLTLKNTYLRYLGAYIRFYDADGNAMKVATWKADNSLVADLVNGAFNVQYDDLRFIGYVGPVNNVLAIPILADPGKLEVTVTFPIGAVSASVYGSGLGTGSDTWPLTPIVGGVATGLLNLAVPSFMLAFGTATQASKPLYDVVDGLMKNKKFIGAVIGGGIIFFGAQFGVAAAHKEMNWHALTQLASLLFDPAATKLLIFIMGEMTAEEVADEIPFAGWIVCGIDIAVGLAQMAETIVEVATSPWNIENVISTSITTNVSVHPDPRHAAFPQPLEGARASCVVKMIYKDQARATVSYTADVADGSTATVLPASFPGNTLGGEVKFEADYFTGDWLAAKATTGWIANNDSYAAQVDLYLVQLPVPLTAQSIYQHTSLLTYQSGVYAWYPTATAPTATITSSNTSSTGNSISVWSGLSLSQKKAMIGFAWKAAGMGIVSATTGQGGQLFAMQNINIPGTPMAAAKFPSAGFDAGTQLIYDPFPPKFKMGDDGQWILGDNDKPVPDPDATQIGDYYIDPRNATVAVTEGGGYHLRNVVLDATTPFDLDAIQPSHGRFAYFPDSFALHPSGHVIGINAQYHKMQIVQILAKGASDVDVPVGRIYGGEALDPKRPGLLYYPVAVTCSYDGTIFVLEDTKSSSSGDKNTVVARVQAFDLLGNPVNRFFDTSNTPSPFLLLASASDYTYLDVAAVGDAKMTYLYVLYYTGEGSSPSDYHMAIYQYGAAVPGTNPLVTTDGVAAAKLAVDMWHTVYTLNYDMVTDGQGHHAGPTNGSTAPAGRTVPSVSEWLPPVPSKSA